MNKELTAVDRTRVALQERPYGLGVVPEPEVFEYTDPRNELAVEERWTEVLERLGAKVLGVRDVLTETTRLTLDGIEWEISPMREDVEYRIPQEVFHRIRAAEAAGVRFAWWVWGEEQFARPSFQAAPDLVEPVKPRAKPVLTAASRRALDPVVIGVIPTGPARGLWVRLGVWFH
jgi:hypothetical protein